MQKWRNFGFPCIAICLLAVLCLPANAELGENMVLPGLDVLVRDEFRQLSGRRVGLITNQTGVSRSGVSGIRLLHDAADVDLVVVFSPEHGLHGKLDIPVIADSIDTDKGIKVVSLYGKSRRPTPEMLADIDTLVFDIQDIGTRFYTYISTMGYAMQAAAESRLRFVVLDRPNPINGLDISGPVLDEDKQSFVGFHRLPVRHGMSAGELALMFAAELKLDLELLVIPVSGWKRGDFFDATGLTWIDPSPNIRRLSQAILYPGFGLLETTNLSVGRGTDTPFEIFGAPWLDGHRFAEQLNRLHLPGVRFSALEFTPSSSTFDGELCYGVRIDVTRRDTFDPVKTGLTVATNLASSYPHVWLVDDYGRLLGNDAVLRAIKDAESFATIEATYRNELEEFKSRRSRFLLYE